MRLHLCYFTFTVFSSLRFLQYFYITLRNSNRVKRNKRKSKSKEEFMPLLPLHYDYDPNHSFLVPSWFYHLQPTLSFHQEKSKEHFSSKLPPIKVLLIELQQRKRRANVTNNFISRENCVVVVIWTDMFYKYCFVLLLLRAHILWRFLQFSMYLI